MMYVRWVKLHPDAKVPQYSKEMDVGADLSSIEAVTIYPGERKLVDTGIAIQAECQSTTNFGYFRISPRSGLAVKGIDVGAGVVDYSYTGPIKVLVINNSKNDFSIYPGDRIAQLIAETASKMYFIETDKLQETDRGSGGFGSTGV